MALQLELEGRKSGTIHFSQVRHTLNPEAIKHQTPFPRTAHIPGDTSFDAKM